MIDRLHRTIKRDGEEIKQKRCSAKGEWRDETDFHFRTKRRDVRSSRCRWCAAEAQRDLRLRKKGLQERKPGGRFGVEPDSGDTSEGRAERRKAS